MDTRNKEPRAQTKGVRIRTCLVFHVDRVDFVVRVLVYVVCLMRACPAPSERS